MPYYETIFILDSLLTPEEIDKSIQQVQDLIEKSDGKVLNIDKWGKRRLAYEIQKKQYGFYVAIEFEDAGKSPAILENEYNYNDKIIRYLTYRFDKKKLRQWKKQQEKRKMEKVSKKKVIEQVSTDDKKSITEDKDAN
jgi:small subunit ribosomal protein S6